MPATQPLQREEASVARPSGRADFQGPVVRSSALPKTFRLAAISQAKTDERWKKMAKWGTANVKQVAMRPLRLSPSLQAKPPRRAAGTGSRVAPSPRPEVVDTPSASPHRASRCSPRESHAAMIAGSQGRVKGKAGGNPEEVICLEPLVKGRLGGRGGTPSRSQSLPEPMAGGDPGGVVSVDGSV